MFTVLIGLICSTFAIAIAISRIYLGAHSWNQVIYGSFISITFILFLDRETYKKITFHLFNEGYLLNYAIPLSLFVMNAALSLLIINNSPKRVNPFWKFWEKCGMCQGSFKNESISNNFILFFVVSIYLAFGVRNRIIRMKFYPKKINQKIYYFDFNKNILIFSLFTLPLVFYIFGFLLVWLVTNPADKPFDDFQLFVENSAMGYYFGLFLEYMHYYFKTLVVQGRLEKDHLNSDSDWFKKIK